MRIKMAKSEEYKKKALERKKRFQKQMIKNNIFKSRKFNNTEWKKKEKNPQSGKALRTRGFFEVIPTENIQKVPKCSHGPCLLFKRSEGNILETYFACAIYRNNVDKCNFKIMFNDKTGTYEQPEVDSAKKKKKKIFGYNRIPKSLSQMNENDTVLYCKDCQNVFANRHACVCESIEREKLQYPTSILPPLDDQNGESQYFFSSESLEVLIKTVEMSNVDGVLCIGTPRIFETVKARKTAKNVFLLDYDKRFAKFFPSSEFAQYSMLVDHFFDKNSLEKLMDFFKKSKSVLLIVDPPFGVFMEPLLKSIEKMRDRFVSTGCPLNQFYSLIILPIFIRKHVLHGSFWMSDYRVTYDGHKVYQYPEKTVVRIFTDLSSKCINLKEITGYKFCDLCDRYVTEQNHHCYSCNSCTSIEQPGYYHCDECSKCVKPTYSHCKWCQRCHLIGRCINSC